VLDDVVPDLIADRVLVPDRTAQQVLHAIGGRIPGVLSQRPAVLAGQLGQPPAHERGCSPPGFHPSEVAGDTAQQLIQGLLPAGEVDAWACGHRLIFGCLHSAG
jgi:hypothetical protein